jgi:transposase
VGTAGAADPVGAARRATAQDRHARGDERHLVPDAHPLSVALPATRRPSATLEVYNIFRKFQREGVWEAIWTELHMALRERMGREANPSAAVLDSQWVKSVEKGAVKTTKWGTTSARR